LRRKKHASEVRVPRVRLIQLRIIFFRLVESFTSHQGELIICFFAFILGQERLLLIALYIVVVI
jgi:hypothetical protein